MWRTMRMRPKLKKNKTPLVSILTPTFKRSKLLKLLAKCIINQDYPINKIEWIIVDGENNEKHFNLNTSENVENKIHWYETKYSLGGQRDIEFLEFFYNDPKYHATIENIEEKKHFIRKAKMFYFIIDQYVNLTYSNQKPSTLTNQILGKLQKNLKINDLGSLKLSLKNTKNEINKYLSLILEHS